MEFLFYDYETTGTSSQFDQILQFAAKRTDANLSQIGEPINLLCKLRKDVIPSPWAIKVTEINLDYIESKGISEFEFSKKIERELVGNGNQCIVGYNSKAFDDKFTQFLFYRNFIDPYRWFWDSNNSKLDLFDFVLIGYSFDLLNNVKFSDGNGEVSLKLEKLSAFNNLTHENAHDALSDVIATIELMKLIKSVNIKLFDYVIQLRNKSTVNTMLNQNKTFHHISSFYGYENKFVSLHHLVAIHPSNRNSYISWDLQCDPELILNMNSDEIRKEMYAKKEDRKINVGFTEIKINQNPTFIPFNENKVHPKIDLELAKTNLEKLKTNMTKIETLSNEVFKYDIPFIDADADLYAGQFFDEKRVDNNIINSVYGDPLNVNRNSFKSTRFSELHKRLVGRNFYHLLPDSDKNSFDLFCKNKYEYLGDDKWRTMKKYNEELKEINLDETLTEDQKRVLNILDKHVKDKVS